MDIGIFGGCVSRDIFRLYPENDQVKFYAARTSLISQYSNPTRINMDDVKLTSAFQKRLIKEDFNKTLTKNLNGLEVDYFIIDFLVERLSLFFNGENYITRSTELINSGITKNNNYKLGKVIHRKLDNKEILEEWYKACGMFIQTLKSNFEPTQIILNEVYLTEYFINEDKEIKVFDEKNLNTVKETNALLHKYYTYFKQNFDGIRCINIPKEYCIADANHQWGLNPMHFINDYYSEARKQLNHIYKDVI